MVGKARPKKFQIIEYCKGCAKPKKECDCNEDDDNAAMLIPLLFG
jgi:hypothetical protein